jgi:membrane-associated phospholipid phosphatase
MQKKIFFLILAIVVVNSLHAQVDTMRHPFRSMLFPAALIGYGSTTIGVHGYPSSQSVKDWRTKNYPTFHSKVDDVLWATPVALAYGLNIVGVKGKHSLKEMTKLTVLSALAFNAVIQPMKYGIGILRPDGSTYNSFPSGHTASAFTAAEILHQEYGQKSVWFSVLGYTAATATGAMRILNNRHWSSDVLVGAGIGMLSTKLVYWGYEKYQKKHSRK